MPYKDKAKAKLANRISGDKNRAKKRQIVLMTKNRPCSDCGVQYPYYVMEFDHVRGEKKFEIAYAVRYAIQDVMEELLKCDVVCSNCHKTREFNRGYDHTTLDDAEVVTSNSTVLP